VFSLSFVQSTSVPPGAHSGASRTVAMQSDHGWFGQPEPAVLVDYRLIPATGAVQTTMDSQWDDSLPIYGNCETVVAMISKGTQGRRPAALGPQRRCGLPPESAHRAQGYQQLVDEQLVEKRRAWGCS